MTDIIGTPSEFAPSEPPVSDVDEVTPEPHVTFPPYPPYAVEPVAASVAETVVAGHDLRVQHKSLPRQPIKKPPKPAKPKSPKVTDVKLSRRAARAYARCLRKHGAVLTDRLERMAKPPRRHVINLWREHADTLPPETISRFRSMLDADEPFKPDQAYEYFINVKKAKKRSTAFKGNQIKKDAVSMCGDKRFQWARNATVAFARGIQQRLSRPGKCVLADGMLRLSNIILQEICGYMHMRCPSRCSTNPKAKFMMEVADKVAVWIDEILSESEDRMLMMDFDEDEDVLRGFAKGDDGFEDDFLNMMGDGKVLAEPQPAYLKFTGDMLDAFIILTNSMEKKGDQQLLTYGKFSQTYSEGSAELKRTPDLNATKFNPVLAEQLNNDLSETAKPNTPQKLETAMKDVVNICSNYLAQHAELNKDKGAAFALLVKTMRTIPDEQLYQRDKITKNYGQGASELEDAESLETDHDDPNLSQELNSKLTNLMSTVTPNDLKSEMKDTIDISSKYLSQRAVDEGDALKYLLGLMKQKGDAPLAQIQGTLQSYDDGATRIENAASLASNNVDEEIYKTVKEKLTKLVDDNPSAKFAYVLPGIVDICAKFLASPSAGLLDSGSKGDIRPSSGAPSRTSVGAGSGIGVGKGSSAGLADDQGRLTSVSSEGRQKREDKVPDLDEALRILLAQMRSHGTEIFYKQQQTELSHELGATWITMKPRMNVDETVKKSSDTARLSKKFEKKLCTLVAKVTPPYLTENMQDVVIECARILAEYFISINYKSLVREGLISEMQKRENEIFAEFDGSTETYFFSAQRLKKVQSLEIPEHRTHFAQYLSKKLDDLIRCRSTARKLTSTMKDHIRNAGGYLSDRVTKPGDSSAYNKVVDEQIEAYVVLLREMEAAGNALLIEGDIPKSYKDAAAYLKRLTSFEDQIKLPNPDLQSSTERKLQNIMANIAPTGYTKPVMDSVIRDSTGLLVSYIVLQVEKTKALNVLIQNMEEAGERVLLRHGNLYKSYADGANRLRGKNTDQLRDVTNADLVVARKIHIKLTNLMKYCTPDVYKPLMNDVIEDATIYLSVHFLQPHVIKVCKCKTNVFVQCELWCDEILRRVPKPCCTCSRHVSAQALEDLALGQPLPICTGSSKVFAPGIEISITQCQKRQGKTEKCDDKQSKTNKPSTSYLMYATARDHRLRQSVISLASQSSSIDPLKSPITLSPSPSSGSSISLIKSVLYGCQSDNVQILGRRDETDTEVHQQLKISNSSSLEPFDTTPLTNSGTSRDVSTPYWQKPTTMFSSIYTKEINQQTQQKIMDTVKSPRKLPQATTEYNARAPIISTDQMTDWHAMMVSLMWNVQAWRDWIQGNIDRALAYRRSPEVSQAEPEVPENWTSFQRRAAIEALQWRQYNNFSRQLTLRLAKRYKDKRIMSPTRGTDKIDVYLECQKEMLDIINMFNRWTQWLTAVIKETDTKRSTADTESSLHESRWNRFKQKVLEFSDDWNRYNLHLKVCWDRYKSLITDWLPTWEQSGPVWVVSACGTVPSGAVAAGIFDGEVVWIARTTHKCYVLPAALHPSKHCCLVYADGTIHHYTKYQVMCNAQVSWVAWRAGTLGARAVRVAPGVYVGRILYCGSHLVGAVHAPNYRCHVVIFGRPFAFNCYELLVLADGD